MPSSLFIRLTTSLLLYGLFLALGLGVSKADDRVKGDWLVQSMPADIDTLNPCMIQDASSATIAGYIFEGMVTRDPFTGQLVPQLATSWDISPDKLVFTFHLRTDVKWQDGQPFTADDVKYTYDRIMDPKDDTAPNRIGFDNIKSCEVLDAHTVRFTCSNLYFKTLENLGFWVIPKHIVDDGTPFNDNDKFNRHPVGTGPFKFIRWDTGNCIVIERNDQYWGMPYYLKRMLWEIISEPVVAIQLLKKGEIDLDAVPALNWKRQLENSSAMATRLKLQVTNIPVYYYLGFNLRDPLFADVKVRHAIDLLIPRDDILHDIYQDKFATKVSGPYAPFDPGYNKDVQVNPCDPTQAQQLLTDAGWMKGSDGFLHKGDLRFSFTLLIRAGEGQGQR